MLRPGRHEPVSTARILEPTEGTATPSNQGTPTTEAQGTTTPRKAQAPTPTTGTR